MVLPHELAPSRIESSQLRFELSLFAVVDSVFGSLGDVSSKDERGPVIVEEEEDCPPILLPEEGCEKRSEAVVLVFAVPPVVVAVETLASLM